MKANSPLKPDNDLKEDTVTKGTSVIKAKVSLKADTVLKAEDINNPDTITKTDNDTKADSDTKADNDTKTESHIKPNSITKMFDTVKADTITKATSVIKAEDNIKPDNYIKADIIQKTKATSVIKAEDNIKPDNYIKADIIQKTKAAHVSKANYITKGDNPINTDYITKGDNPINTDFSTEGDTKVCNSKIKFQDSQKLKRKRKKQYDRSFSYSVNRCNKLFLLNTTRSYSKIRKHDNAVNDVSISEADVEAHVNCSPLCVKGQGYNINLYKQMNVEENVLVTRNDAVHYSDEVMVSPTIQSNSSHACMHLQGTIAKEENINTLGSSESAMNEAGSINEYKSAKNMGGLSSVRRDQYMLSEMWKYNTWKCVDASPMVAISQADM